MRDIVFCFLFFFIICRWQNASKRQESNCNHITLSDHVSGVFFTQPVKQTGRFGETKKMGNFIHFPGRRGVPCCSESRCACAKLAVCLQPEEQGGSWYSFRGNQRLHPTAKSLSAVQGLNVATKFLNASWGNSLWGCEKLRKNRTNFFHFF